MLRGGESKDDISRLGMGFGGGGHNTLQNFKL